MKYNKKYWEIIALSCESACRIAEELSLREYHYGMVEKRDIRNGKLTGWIISVVLTKQDWLKLRSELYPAFGSMANFYTSNNVKNM